MELDYDYLLKYYNRVEAIAGSGCINLVICEHCGLPEEGGQIDENDLCGLCRNKLKFIKGSASGKTFYKK